MILIYHRNKNKINKLKRNELIIKLDPKRETKNETNVECYIKKKQHTMHSNLFQLNLHTRMIVFIIIIKLKLLFVIYAMKL